MRRLRLVLAATVVAGICLHATARADLDGAPPPAPTRAELQKRLAGFDPKAVAAARHYFGQPAMRTGLDAMIDNLDKAMAQQIGQQNPSAPPEKLAIFRKAAADALKARLDLILDMNMVNALDAFSTNEIVALDGFYSSPEGAGILAKMPKVMAALPAMVRSILPDYFADVQARVKAAGGDFKL